MLQVDPIQKPKQFLGITDFGAAASDARRTLHYRHADIAVVGPCIFDIAPLLGYWVTC